MSPPLPCLTPTVLSSGTPAKWGGGYHETKTIKSHLLKSPWGWTDWAALRGPTQSTSTLSELAPSSRGHGQDPPVMAPRSSVVGEGHCRTCPWHKHTCPLEASRAAHCLSYEGCRWGKGQGTSLQQITPKKARKGEEAKGEDLRHQESLFMNLSHGACRRI